jgi:hypothetical protein
LPRFGLAEHLGDELDRGGEGHVGNGHHAMRLVDLVQQFAVSGA